ncbi:putative quinol monooxygenase [Roseomonas elaeocarpi]|uniref:Quinol monooxygenase n=1 Tax=Roseomonas elaeocarpi TaxID=907779 RepID=A0ABV6JRM9_9PROT
MSQTTPVVAVFVTKPGAEEKVEAMFRAVVPTTLAEEGCITYQLHRDSENPRRFVFTEEWASRELLDRHLAAPHIATLFAALPEHLESSEVSVLTRLA